MEKQTWEYKIYETKRLLCEEEILATTLNCLGKDGWELVSTVYVGGDHGVHHTFKRRL